jgi:hypothetical protein
MAGSTSLAVAQNRVSAKIGIQLQADNQVTWAKTRETLKAGDMLRVYIVPEADAYIYLVYSDGKTPVLLNGQTHKKLFSKGSIGAFPSENEFYQTDGANPIEAFTIICSPHGIPEIATLLSAANPSPEKWRAFEEELVKKSKINMGHKSEKPFAIAGNVRGITEEKPEDPAKDLLVYSGESLLVKRYEFSVKK